MTPNSPKNEREPCEDGGEKASMQSSSGGNTLSAGRGQRRGEGCSRVKGMPEVGM